MQFLGRFFRALWRFLDGLRRVLHLLLLLALFAILVGALRESIPRLPERGALVIHPTGEIVEQLAGVPLERALSEAGDRNAPQTLLWDLTEAIRTAADDNRIQALLIETDDIEGVGQVKLEELAAAIGAFRAKGKKVIAYGSYFLQGQYYLAAQADEVYLDPFGFVLLDGYARYGMFFKDALDRLGVDVHLFRAGRYKSAAEPFVRRDMSPEDRAIGEAVWKELADTRLHFEVQESEHLEGGRLGLRGRAVGEWMGRPYERGLSFVMEQRGRDWFVWDYHFAEVEDGARDFDAAGFPDPGAMPTRPPPPPN